MRHKIRLDSEIRRQLETLAHTANAPRLAQRCQIILVAAQPGISSAEVARRCGTSPATVRLWQKRFAKDGINGLADRPRAGAPWQINTDARVRVLNLHSEGLSTRRIASRTGISQSSVARIIREVNARPDQAPPSAGLDPTAWEQLTLSLFQSLSDDVPFARFLAELEDATGSEHGVFLTFPSDNRRPSLILSAGQPLEGTLSYLEKYYAKEVMTNIPAGRLVTLGELFSADALRSTELYREYLSRYGIGHVLGLNIGSVRGIAGGLRLTRRENRPDFGPQERAICERLIPYLQAAFDLFVQRSDMEAEKDALSLTISGMSVGSITVDADGHILEANPPARTMLEKQDGLILSGTRVAVHNPRQSRQLQSLIQQNAMASIDPSVPSLARVMRIDRPSGRESLSLLIRPATVSADNRLVVRPTAMLHLVDPAQPRTTMVNALSELFDLTPAEARVAIALSNGLSLRETADQIGTSLNTVCSQLRAIFSKLGVNRQAQLIRTILISMALFSLQTE